MPNTTKSPARATPLQSPGCNEGKARNATLGEHGQKRIELRRSGTHSEHLVCGFAFVRKVPPLWGSINVFQCITQGLRPGLCRSIALTGLLADKSNFLSIICRSNHWIYWAVWLFAVVVGFVGWCHCLRLLSDLLFGVVVCAYCRIYWVVLA